jgi:hypothetical protein
MAPHSNLLCKEEVSKAAQIGDRCSRNTEGDEMGHGHVADVRGHLVLGNRVLSCGSGRRPQEDEETGLVGE